MNVSYKLRANSLPDGEYTVSGEFGYLLNDETQRIDVGSSTFTIGNMAYMALQQMEQNMRPTDASDAALNMKEKPAATKVEEEVAATTPKNDPPAMVSKGVPAPETGIAYKVQISAAHREVGKPYFVQRHRFNGDFNIEHHQGWIKYTTGRFSQYGEARDQRIAFIAAGHDFPGPFVTAYNNGERITVQEALMLSSQKWVQ